MTELEPRMENTIESWAHDEDSFAGPAYEDPPQPPPQNTNPNTDLTPLPTKAPVHPYADPKQQPPHATPPSPVWNWGTTWGKGTKGGADEEKNPNWRGFNATSGKGKGYKSSAPYPTYPSNTTTGTTIRAAPSGPPHPSQRNLPRNGGKKGAPLAAAFAVPFASAHADWDYRRLTQEEMLNKVSPNLDRGGYPSSRGGGPVHAPERSGVGYQYEEAGGPVVQMQQQQQQQQQQPRAMEPVVSPVRPYVPSPHAAPWVPMDIKGGAAADAGNGAPSEKVEVFDGQRGGGGGGVPARYDPPIGMPIIRNGNGGNSPQQRALPPTAVQHRGAPPASQATAFPARQQQGMATAWGAGSNGNNNNNNKPNNGSFGARPPAGTPSHPTNGNGNGNSNGNGHTTPAPSPTTPAMTSPTLSDAARHEATPTAPKETVRAPPPLSSASLPECLPENTSWADVDDEDDYLNRMPDEINTVSREDSKQSSLGEKSRSFSDDKESSSNSLEAETKTWAKRTPTKTNDAVADLRAKMAAKREQSSPVAPASTEEPASTTPAPIRVAGLRGQEVKRLPGQATGGTLLFEGLTDCRIVIADALEEVSLVQCVRCVVFLGPTRGAVLLKRCEDTAVSCISGRLSIEDSTHVTVSCFVASPPVLNNVRDVELAPHHTACPLLGDLMTRSTLDASWPNKFDVPVSESERDPPTGFTIVQEPRQRVPDVEESNLPSPTTLGMILQHPAALEA